MNTNVFGSFRESNGYTMISHAIEAAHFVLFVKAIRDFQGPECIYTKKQKIEKNVKNFI